MKSKILICIFSIIFGILIGINVPKADAAQSPMPSVNEVTELQSGQAAGNLTWTTMSVNGKKVVVFQATTDQSVDIELFW